MLTKNIHPDFQRERLSPHFVYESYDEESGLFFNRGSVGFVLIANPLPGTDITAQTEIADFISNVENIPNGASIQILMLGSSDISFLLNRWKNERKGAIYTEMAKRRCDFLHNKAKEQGAIKDSHLLISVTVPDLEADLIAMDRRRSELKATFKAIRMWTEDVDSRLLVSFLRKIWGRESLASVNINPYASLSEQILPGNFSLEEKNDIAYLKDGEAFIALDAEERPEQWSLGLMDLFLGSEARRSEFIETDYLLHVGIQILPNQSLSKARIIAKREAIEKNIKSGMGKWLSGLTEEYQDISGAFEEIQNNNRVVHIHTNIILKGKEARVKLAAKSYSSMMRRNGWNFVPTKYDHLAHMLAAMPMSMVEEEKGYIKKKLTGIGMAISSIGRGKQTVSSETKAIMPIIGEYKGDLNAPGLLLTGRRGQLKFFSQFGSDFAPHLSKSTNSNESNPNVCIAGVAGSGKSVLMQEIMLSTLGIGGQVFVLDYGKSFKNLCQILEGNYIEFNPSRPVSINPFSAIPTGDNEASILARDDFLASFPITLATMAAPKYGTNDLQQTLLSQALREVWREKQTKMEIDDIADWLLRHEIQTANDLGRMLFNYTSQGSYGHFFQGKAEVTMDADIVVIETDHLRNFRDLMAVVTQIMMTHINSTMAKRKTHKPNLLVFDEITKTLENPTALKFVSAVIRIVRKYKTSVTLATQLITDFHDLGPDAASIFAGADFKLIMNQTSDTLKMMRNLPLFQSYVETDERLRRMQSVKSSKGEYGEFSIWSPNINGDICQLHIDPFTLLLMSTNPTDKQLVADYKAQGLSLIESINHILADRGQL